MNTSNRNARGFSLIEVMIAVIVLAVGLLALAVLQGELFRSGAESKARANAATIAQQVIEDARTFGFVSPPDAAYVGNTYTSLASGDWEVDDVAGVDFDVEREVVRYRWDAVAGEFAVPAAGTPVTVGVPEFKMVRVNVAWTDSTGEEKSVQMTDSIAAISPADVAKVMQGPSAASRGPEFWIVPPNKDNPRVVPIAVGGDQSSASSNPTPEQFVEDVSAVTRFSVLSFSGSTTADEVKLTRRQDMAAASCVCQEGGESTTAYPAYEPTVWNGVLLQYDEPRALPAGTPIGTAVVANADSEIEPICTVCCRDHHAGADRSLVPDPWRSVQGDSITTHYGYGQQGQGYDIQGGLLPTSDTGGEYVDACQLTRVNGRMRLMVDAQQVAMVTTPLNAAGTGYRVTDFINQFSGYVTTMLTQSLGTSATLPTGYPSPTAKFPGPTSALNTTYASVVSPSAISIAENENVNLVTFGVYVDYLSDDTLFAYKCALADDNTGDCAGLGTREPLSVLPFFAVNIASLGDWCAGTNCPQGTTNVVQVAGATYNNQGSLASIGGIVTGGKGASPTDGSGALIPTPVKITINNSNSGLAGTAAVDPDDQLASNYIPDEQGFTKSTGSSGGQTRTLTVNTVQSSTLKINAVTTTFVSLCNYSNQDKVSNCTFEAPLASQELRIANYNTLSNGNNPTLTDRKICFPTDPKIGTPNVVNANTINEYTTVQVSSLGATNYAMLISVVGQSTTCPASGLTMTP